MNNLEQFAADSVDGRLQRAVEHLRVDVQGGVDVRMVHQYMHQCATAATVEGDATLDVTVSSTTDLVALNASTSPSPPDSRIVSGTVFAIMANRRQPVRNVWVGWEAAMDGFVAETRTDAAGHYRLCGLPRERITISAAPAYGTVFYAPVDLGSDAIVDIEIASKKD